MRLFSIILLMTMIFCSAATGEGERSDPRIVGVAEFMVDRVNANYVYVMQNQFRSELALLTEYFPRTGDLLKNQDFWTLMASKGVWQSVLESDLVDFVARMKTSVAESIAEDIVKQIPSLNEKDRTAERKQKKDAIIKELVTLIDNRTISKETLLAVLVDILNMGAVRTAAKTFLEKTPNWQILNSSVFEKFKFTAFSDDELIDLLKKKLPNKDSSLPGAGSPVIPPNPAATGTVTDPQNLPLPETRKLAAEAIGTIVTAATSASASTKDEVAKAVDKYKDLFDRLVTLVQMLKLLTDQSSGPKNYAPVVVAIGSFIRDTKIPSPLNSLSKKSRETLARFSLLIAELADADSADEVKAILTATALPPVSFGIKQSGNVSFLLGSSFDLAYSTATKLSTPVRLDVELNVPAAFGSFDFFYSPVDLTKPVLEVANHGTDEFSYADILSQAFGLSLTIKGSPIRVAVTYVDDRKQDFGLDSFVVGIGLDMPIFTLYSF